MSATELLDAPSTALAKPQPINWTLLREQAVAVLDIQREMIEAEVAADTKIIVTNDETRAEANKVRMKWVRRRTGLDRTRKAASEDAKKIVALVKEVAETAQSRFDVAEQHLSKQIDEYDLRIETAKREAIEREFAAKNDRLVAAGLTLPRILIDSMSDLDIDDKISEAVELARFRKAQAEKEAAEKHAADLKAKEDAETFRKQQAELAQQRAEFEKQQAEAKAERDRIAKIEADKLAAERAELDRIKAGQLAQQQAIEREQQRLAKIESDRIAAEKKAEQERLAAIVRANLEAERKEAEKKAAEEADRREAERKKAEAEQTEIKRKQLEAMRPDKLKLNEYLDGIAERVRDCPECPGAMQNVAVMVKTMLLSSLAECRELVGE